ncbi:MAG: hypothetical protein K9I68_05925 [Bacteroidales bacterium]|nr:hypothetical protein [Bacteroidales bacterium]MCF8338126.1 hypothetical protein [Bacteroidales bacterium]
MNIQAEKLKIMKQVLETDNPRILSSIQKIFERELEDDFWNYLSQSQKEEIKTGLREIENGEIADYEDFMKKYR